MSIMIMIILNMMIDAYYGFYDYDYDEDDCYDDY